MEPKRDFILPFLQWLPSLASIVPCMPVFGHLHWPAQHHSCACAEGHHYSTQGQWRLCRLSYACAAQFTLLEKHSKQAGRCIFLHVSSAVKNLPARSLIQWDFACFNVKVELNTTTSKLKCKPTIQICYQLFLYKLPVVIWTLEFTGEVLEAW